MRINSGAELTSGLSDIPVLLACLAMLCVACRHRNSGRVGRAWFALLLTVPVTAAMGAAVHIFSIEERYLKVLWPVVYLLITLITGLFWILIREIFHPGGADRRSRISMLCAVSAVSIVNGLQRFFLGYDLTPVFTLFALPVVVHCAYMVIRGRDRVSGRVRRMLAAGVVLLLLSVVVETAMRRPVSLLGMEFGGAFFAHLLIIAAIIALTGTICPTSEETASDE